jgi:single-stranded-DNA-specific exonuclease
MKDRHLRLELVQESTSGHQVSETTGAIRAIGWNLAAQIPALGLIKGIRIDLAYRIRENPHPDFGGLEVEIVGMEAANA